MIDYSYDALARLTEADYNGGSTVYNYGYDVAGNMIDFDGTTRTFNDANQMTNDGTNTLTYDNNGNLRTVGSDTYTWDRANRLLGVGNHSYVYDGLGNRIQQTVSSVVTDYLNDLQPGLTKLLKQTTGTNVERFVHAPRGIHAVDAGTDWNFYANDGLGSVRATVDDAGVVQSSLSYDPYGMPLGTTPDNFGFTGEQTDANGSLFLRARYYEPQLGIFSALDPWEGISNRPMSLNGYSWVEGNVPNAVDPSGLMPIGFSAKPTGNGFQLNIKWNPIYWNLENPLVIQSMNSGLCDGGKGGHGKRGGGSRILYSDPHQDGSDIGEDSIVNQFLDAQRCYQRKIQGGYIGTTPITNAQLKDATVVLKLLNPDGVPLDDTLSLGTYTNEGIWTHAHLLGEVVDAERMNQLSEFLYPELLVRGANWEVRIPNKPDESNSVSFAHLYPIPQNTSIPVQPVNVRRTSISDRESSFQFVYFPGNNDEIFNNWYSLQVAESALVQQPDSNGDYLLATNSAGPGDSGHGVFYNNELVGVYHGRYGGCEQTYSSILNA